MSSEETRARTSGALREELQQLRQEGARGRPARAQRAPAGAAPTQPPADEGGADHARYDHSLAEFPAFRFGKRRLQSDDLIRFADSISGPRGQRLERSWTVFPSAKWGYGGATTQALLFDLHQIWKDQGFRGGRIYFGTLRKLYRRQHPGKNPAPLDYARLRRDLDILCGYEFDCDNAFWDPVSRTYGNMRAWHLFTGWYEARRARSGDLQEEPPVRLHRGERHLRASRPGAGLLRDRLRQRLLPRPAPGRAAARALPLEDVRLAAGPPALRG
ncbi:MAG: hypothetical protein M5T61_18365 [Acidimicrobiia bacterium]|nr:hypothetical protein [Acidimicrobiia bacterium]